MYSDHSFPSLISSQILPTSPTPFLLSLSLENEQEKIQNFMKQSHKTKQNKQKR